MDFDLDDIMEEKSSKKEAKNKNVIPQILQKLRKNDSSLTKVVLRNEPVTKTALSIAQALKTNNNLTSLALYKTKITDEAAKEFAEMLKINKTLTHLTLVETELTGDGMYEIMKSIRENNTITHLKINNGTKYWTSWVETALPDNFEENKSIVTMQIRPIRQISTSNKLDQIPHKNRKNSNQDLDFENDDSYVYVYDPNWVPSDD